MKRSEMVNKIQIYNSYWEGHPDKKCIANALLDIIEQSGMLPPKIKNPEYKSPLLQMDWTKDVIYEWEPE